MVSEEIELNRTLEAAGPARGRDRPWRIHRSTAGEKPAHIITPAVHLRRHEVGKLFARETWHSLYRRYSYAYQHGSQSLREVFLSADVGITGVNFGVSTPPTPGCRCALILYSDTPGLHGSSSRTNAGTWTSKTEPGRAIFLRRSLS